MRPGSANGRRLALLFGVALAIVPVRGPAAPPEAVPDGFVREDLKEIHASILRPEKWVCRVTIPAAPFYDFSPQPFEEPLSMDKGVAVHVMVKTDEPADERAAKKIAEVAAQHKVLRGWTRKYTPAEPFTTYGAVYVLQSEETDGVKMICEGVIVANRVTNTVYECWLIAPADRWKDIEQTGEAMLASLRLDPKF